MYVVSLTLKRTAQRSVLAGGSRCVWLLFWRTKDLSDGLFILDRCHPSSRPQASCLTSQVTSGTEKIEVERHDSNILWQILDANGQLREPSCFNYLLDPDVDVQQAESERASERLLEGPSEQMTEDGEKYILLLRRRSREMKVRFFGILGGVIFQGSSESDGIFATLAEYERVCSWWWWWNKSCDVMKQEKRMKSRLTDRRSRRAQARRFAPAVHAALALTPHLSLSHVISLSQLISFILTLENFPKDSSSDFSIFDRSHPSRRPKSRLRSHSSPAHRNDECK